ncbi:cell wall-binding repeat-containing protein [Leifsonia flava]|uniref:M23ase beta-sheet core domain-containing protein n=1 Tax=Orlajensenia leifsoniae TaxID=2561933 RepID=A0A4Y9QSY9_9MICO|nr:cell wall-binding repeat-containing protein [Leifsonia flava]TFV94065.1 hypothetical protein E4M00_17460 [Leifsonia flava]
MNAVAIAAAVIIGFGAVGPAVGAELAPGSSQSAATTDAATTTESTGDATAPPTEAPAADPAPDASTSPPPPPEPSADPSAEPSTEPTAEPEPTTEPTTEPTVEPAPAPSAEPTTEPSAEPTPEPTAPVLSDEKTNGLLGRAAPKVQTVIKPFAPGAQRLSGADRYETAVSISRRFSPNVPVVYIATGATFPDALSAAATAAAQGGPLLLTQTAVLPEVVRAEIVRLAPARIVVAGGEAAVSADVYTTLSTLTPSIERLGGASRYETSELLVGGAFRSSREAFIATGRDFPDALAASAAAGKLGAPVFLIDGVLPGMGQSTYTLLERLGVKTVRIAGGSAAVSDSIESQVSSRGYAIKRHQGQDRYLTAAAINDAVFRTSPAQPLANAFIATGADFADALPGAALAGGLRSPLYITRAECIPQPAAIAINELQPVSRVILGGEAVVGNAVLQNTACAQVWAKPASGRITGSFGPREPICTPGGCSQSVHRGTDIGTGCWAPIYAASGGRVSYAEPLGTYGNFVKIAHGDGIDTGYAHIVTGGTLVRVGQYVVAGQQIAWSGATGAATGCHLHFEVYKNGTQIDAVPFMALQGIKIG